MKLPRPWLQENPATREGRLLREVAGEALPKGALLRAAQRVGVSAAALQVASAGLAQGAAASAASGTTTAALATQVGGSLALWGVLGKATAIGLCVGALGIVAAQRATSPAATHARSSPLASAHAPNAIAAPRVTAAPPASSPPARTTAAALSSIEQPEALRSMHSAMPLPAQERPEPSAVREPSTEPMASARARFSDLPEPRAVAGATTPLEQGVDATDAPRSSSGSGSTLAHEVRALDTVRKALAERDGLRALALLDDAERSGSFHRLGREAAVLRVEALGTSGRLGDARRLAQDLLQGDDVSPTQKKSLQRWLR